MEYTYEYYKKSANYIRERIGFEPEIAIILGSALGPFAERVEKPIVVDYKDIPNFLVSTVSGHAGKLICGTVAGKKVVCMSGRFHSYEGYDFEQLSIPVRVLKILGVKKLILTNAAGAVNTVYRPGDIVIIKDHIKLNGASPMRGKNVDELGPRFFDVTKMYTPELREMAKKIAENSELTVHEGVYFFFPGPQFETPAEIRAARILGGDLVGMSTVTEALTAAHCGLSVLAMSVVSNMAAGVLDQPLSGEEVEETVNGIAEPFSNYMTEIVRNI